MTIYIESFLIQNILINFCLLRLVKVTTKPKTSFFRLVLASTIGAIGSVIGAIFINNVLVLNLIKLVCAICLISVAFKQNKKQFIFSFILLFIFTYAFGGAITSLSGNVQYTNIGVVVLSKISLEAITIFAIILTYIFELVAKHINYKIKTSNLIYPITLYLNNKKITIDAFLDTGNLLQFNNQPVIVIDISAYIKLANLDLVSFYLKESEKINLSTVAGKNNLKLFKIDKVKIKIGRKTKSFINQYVAVNSTESFKNTNYQALLTPQMF